MYAVENTVPAIVVDFGSHTTKIGSAGEDLPRHYFRSSLGVLQRDGKQDYVCGNDLLLQRDGLEVVSAFDEDGQVSNWYSSTRDALTLRHAQISPQVASPGLLGLQLSPEPSLFCVPSPPSSSAERRSDMEKLMDHSFRGINPEEFGFMIAEPTYNPRRLREKMCELMFEKYSSPAVYLGRSAVLSAFASSRTTGVVLDIGASCVTAVPVYEGVVVKNKMLRSMTAGATLTRLVRQQLASRSIDLRPAYSIKKTLIGKLDDAEDNGDDGETELQLRTYEVEDVPCPGITDSYRNFCVDTIAEQVKETICKVNDQPMADPSLYPVSTYELPDGTVVKMGEDKFAAPSHLFRPLRHANLGPAEPNAKATYSEGVSGLVYDAIQHCEAHMHKDMYSGICLTGGTSNFTGLYEQITKELLQRYHKARVLAATGAPERRFCPWTGGSILATFSEFQKNWFSKGEYDENGSSFVHKKCV